ncbi:hypothetical protein EMMF5_006466 [Cystobasidiomycetes sp. EMM_F5]
MEELPAPWTDFYVDTSRERFDRDAAWTYLSTIAYWSTPDSRDFRKVGAGTQGLSPRASVEYSSTIPRQIDSAYLVFGLFKRNNLQKNSMIGMARVVGDGDTNILMDVYIDNDYQGKGLGLYFIREVLEGGGRKQWRWLLHTGDRKDWYEQKLGFTAIGHAGREQMLGIPYYLMERDGLAIQWSESRSGQ